MGWLSMCSLGGFDSPRAYLDDQFTYVREDHRLTVLTSTVIGKNVYYAACERIALADEARLVFAVICLVRHTPQARDGYIFAYKDMDETVGPCESKCPAAILDLLTPTDSQWANEWRARCRATIAARSIDAAKPRLRAGQTIVFDAPLIFTDGQSLNRFTVIADRTKPARLGFRNPATGQLYRISTVKARAYRLINPVIASPGR